MFDKNAQKAIYSDRVAMELPVILIERGDCTFVTKVRNVEKAGANIALIGDTVEENSEVFIMSDDGSGHSINIPSFFINKETMDAFEDSYDNGDHIIIQVKIETAHTNNTSQVDLWISTPFDLSVDTLRGLRNQLPLFGDQIQFDVKIKSKPCVFCPVEEREKDCISNGLYCPIAPISKDETMMSFLETLDGKSLMKQNLLAKCVHKTLNDYSSDASKTMT